jgi:hypothetical protein
MIFSQSESPEISSKRVSVSISTPAPTPTSNSAENHATVPLTLPPPPPPPPPLIQQQPPPPQQLEQASDNVPIEPVVITMPPIVEETKPVSIFFQRQFTRLCYESNRIESNRIESNRIESNSLSFILSMLGNHKGKVSNLSSIKRSF